MTTAKNYSIDMTKGNALRCIITFAIPLIITNVLQCLFNAVDMIVVGSFSSEPNAVGAIGSSTAICSLLVNLFLGISMGATVVIARYVGAKKDDDVSRSVHTSMALSVVLGVLICILGILLGEPLLRLINTPDEIIGLSLVYVRWYLVGIIFNSIFNFGSACLKAIGDTKRPLMIMLIAGCINVCLNLFFVIVLGMSVDGVAIATVLSQVFSATYVVICLIKENSAIKLYIPKVRLHADITKQILLIGVPNGIQSSLFSISNIYIQSAINSLGASVVNGNTAGMSIDGFVYTVMISFQHTGLTYVSQNVGVGDYARVKKSYYLLPLCSFVAGTVSSTLVYLLREPLLSLYLTDPVQIQAGIERLTVICSTYFLCGVMDAFAGILRGAGYSIFPAVFNVIGVVGLRIVWIELFFPIPTLHSLGGVLLSYPITWVITIMALLVYLIFVARPKIIKTCEENRQSLIDRGLTVENS
ncbi:MAG: MATE family efflux transporter [Clostridia bacterium]|nr:MATE family efflux transporter [Clostridia bacterium]